MMQRRRLGGLALLALSSLWLLLLRVPSWRDSAPLGGDSTTSQAGLLWSRCRIQTDARAVCGGEVPHSALDPGLCPLEALTQDCLALKALHFPDRPVSQEELDFPLAFGIKVHTSPAQAEQLLRAIYRPHNVYCIHVDRKAEAGLFRLIKALASCLPNIVLTDRLSFVYGSYDAVRTELGTMKCALSSAVRWRYYLNMAGQEFPLRTNLEMVRILTIFNGTNDIESFPMPERHRVLWENEYRVDQDGRMQRTGSRKGPPPFRAQIRKGRQYSAFSRAFVLHVLHDPQAKAVMDYFSDTLNPDESIWGTINQLPHVPGGYPVHVQHTPNNEHVSRAVAWETEDSYQCRGQYVREVCVFAAGDIPWLLRQPNLVANKFLLEVDALPAACLEAVLHQRVWARLAALDEPWYRSLPHVRYRHPTTA